jgi:hypothetical protein
VPRNSSSYHAGDSIIPDMGAGSITVNGVKYTAVNSQTATSIPNFQ